MVKDNDVNNNKSLQLRFMPIYNGLKYIKNHQISLIYINYRLTDSHPTYSKQFFYWLLKLL